MDNFNIKIKEIMNDKNMKIVIPVIVLVVLLIVVFVYLKEYQYNNYRDKKEFELYQYFGEQKVIYDATISYNKKGVIKAFVPSEYSINYGSRPIYYTDEEINNVIFPSNMIVILPLKREFMYKIPEFSYIEKNSSIQYLTFEDYHKNIDHYVLYDGGDLYFFSDSVKFNIKGEEIILSPLSYVIDTGSSFSYYDYETDTYKVFDNVGEMILSNEHFEVNVTNNNINYLGETILITSNFGFLNTLN